MPSKRQIEEQIKKTKELHNMEEKYNDITLAGRRDLLNEIQENLDDVVELQKIQKNLDAEISDFEKAINKSVSDRYKIEKKITESAIKRVKFNKVVKDISNDIAGELLPEMLGIMDKFINPWTALAIIAVAFSGTLDEIGKTFGAIGIQSLDVRNSLMDAQVEATKLGKEMSDVLTATTQLTNNFWVGLSEALKLSSSVLDTSVALGISTEASGDLIGSFKTLVGLSADQATTVAKKVTLLA